MIQPSNSQTPLAIELLRACVLWSLLIANSGPPVFSQAAQPNPAPGFQEIKPLELGQPVKREIAQDQFHPYLINLAADQYISISVETLERYLRIAIFDPKGKQLIDGSASSRWRKASEFLIVAVEPGTYRLEARRVTTGWVKEMTKDWPPRPYEIKLNEVRTATEKDRVRTAARQALIEADPVQVYRPTPEARQKSMEKYQTALPLWRSIGDQRGEAETLGSMATTYGNSGQPQQALDSYQQTASLFRAIGDRYGESSALIQIGLIKYGAREFKEALSSFNQVIELARSGVAPGFEAFALTYLSSTHSALGEYRQALESLELALASYRANHEITGEILALTTLGELHDRLGEKHLAIDYFSQALQATPAYLSESKCRSLVGLGYFNYQLGDSQSALEYFNQTIAVCRENAPGLYSAGPHALTGSGAVHSELGNQRQALELYGQALERHRALRDREGEAVTLARMGFAYDALGDRAKAIAYLNDGLTQLRAAIEYPFEITTLNKLGSAYATAGDREKARDYYTQALALSQRIGDRQGEAVALLGLARLESQSNHPAEARARIEASLAIIESLRTKIPGQTLRASYLASTSGHYEFYIDLLMQLHRSNPADRFAAAALQASERARARGLLELLKETSADIREGVDARLLDRERSLEQALNARTDEQIRLLSGSHTAERADHLKKAIDLLTLEYQQVQAQIRATSPRYAALTQPRPLSVMELQEQVLDPDTLLLEYALGEERSYLWAVTKSSLNVYELPKRAEIETAARRVYELLTARQRGSSESEPQRQQRVTKADAEYLTEAGALSQTLLGPVVSQLGSKRLAIVASGALQFLSFAALPSPGSRGSKLPVQNQEPAVTRYLIEDHEIVSLPSASVLAEQRQLFAGRPFAKKILGVFADPVFEMDDPRVKRAAKESRKARPNQVPQVAQISPATRGRSTLLTAFRDVSGSPGAPLSRLLHTRREANAISALVDDPRVRLTAVDFAANLTTATGPELGQYRYLHFATHGLLNQVHPELSGIVLSLIDEQGQPQSGFIKLQEIYNLKLSADLVVLSACQTALGKQINGEGIVGLTRGFMYAGAPRVMASLWMVQDDATSQLMADFYRGILRKGQRPAEALRAAQIATLKQKPWRAPFYWAPFVLQGDWR